MLKALPCLILSWRTSAVQTYDDTGDQNSVPYGWQNGNERVISTSASSGDELKFDHGTYEETGSLDARIVGAQPAGI